MKTITMDWEAFEEKYKPIKNKISNREEFNGWLFETYDEDIKHIVSIVNGKNKKYTHLNVWTILVDTGEYKVMITNDYHIVNRTGYIITKVPWNADESIEVIDEDDREDEEEEDIENIEDWDGIN